MLIIVFKIGKSGFGKKEQKKALDSFNLQNVTDLVSRPSSRATLRQLAPRMLLSQPPTRLASYARLLPPAWKQRELKRTLGERNSLLKEELFTMLK